MTVGNPQYPNFHFLYSPNPQNSKKAISSLLGGVLLGKVLLGKVLLGKVLLGEVLLGRVPLGLGVVLQLLLGLGVVVIVVALKVVVKLGCGVSLKNFLNVIEKLSCSGKS